MSAVDRREFLQKAAVASAATGAAWGAPSILGSTTAFAAGSTPASTTTTSTTTPPDTSACVLFDWGPRSTAPLSSSGTGNNSNVQAGNDGTSTLSASSAVVGANPPTVNGTWSGNTYRNFWVHNTAVSGYGSISGYGDASLAGLVLIQNNAGGSNSSASNVTNYQEVTFAFNAPVTSLTFTIYDLSATTAEGATNGYMDSIGFNAAPAILVDRGLERSTPVGLSGTGTFADPLRRTTPAYYWGADPNNPDNNIPLDVTVRFTGPLTELKMRYASISGPSLQFIKIGDIQTGGCSALLPAGS